MAMWDRIGVGDEKPHILPVDRRYALARLTGGRTPRLVVLSETELWPAWLAWLAERDVPVAIVSARLSGATARRLARLGLVGGSLARVYVAAQTEGDAEAYARLGIAKERLVVTGSVKWPRAVPAPPAAVQARLGVAPDEPVVVGGSIRRSELGPFVAMFRRTRDRVPGARCILAPRYVADCRLAEKLAPSSGLATQRWSDVRASNAGWRSEVLVVDTLGDLARLYGAGKVAVVGGSWEPAGGHNPFEAAVYGIPILYGPEMRQPGCERLEQTGQARRMTDWAACGEGLAEVFLKPMRFPVRPYPDAVAETWGAWRRWGIAPESAYLADAEGGGAAIR